MASGTILVVDDHPDNRDLLARRLSKKGYGVETVADGAAALAAVEARPFDLVLLDVMMPGMTGIEVLERLRERYSMTELPVVMASAQTESAAVVQALELGANDYITKPLDFAVALARIQSHLRTARAAATPPPRPMIRLTDDGIAPGSVFDERYRIDGVLGEGGFAVVYHGQQLSTGQRVAIKMLQPRRIEGSRRAEVERRRFELEMRLIGEINHPNVVRLLDSGTIVPEGNQVSEVHTAPTVETDPAGREDDQAPSQTGERTISEQTIPYLVMELLHGETLYAALSREGKFHYRDGVDLLVPVISGVGAAHIRGAIHRDLKPANIFLSRSGGQVHPKVLDFGIAKLTDRRARGLTATAMLVGTPEYMAPEQARGVEVDHRCDQYTLASVLFECVAGRRAFVGRSVIDLVRQVADGDFPEVRDYADVPNELSDVLCRAASREPAERYPTVEDFGLALLPFASESVRAQWHGPLHSAAARTERTSREPALPEPSAAALDTFYLDGEGRRR